MPAPVLQFKRGNAGVAGTVPALRPGEPAISLNNFDFFIGIDTSVANNKFFGSHRYWGREDGTISLKLKLVDKDGTNYLAIKSPDTLAGIVTYQLPGTQGATNSVLVNDGTGILTWGSGSDNAVFSGITTVNGTFLDVNTDADFSGITTFSNTTDNTLGNSNTGAVQVNGGLGVDKNVTVGGNLNVQGYSEFVGVVTFKSGTINLGDENTDNINVGGEFISNLTPNSDDTYDIGITTQRWRDARFAGIGSFATGVYADAIRLGISAATEIDTSSGDLVLNPASGKVVVQNHLDVYGDINATGNVSVGGTTITLRGTDVFIENKDIILGYTTTTTPDDDTANHAGVAIASTEGTPLVSFSVSGINTLPDTYKQMMWFQSGTLGFSTDAFAFNYGVAIGTTTVANGVRLAVGSSVTINDTTVTAPVGDFATLAGTLTGTISTATRAITVDTTGTSSNATYYATFVDTSGGQVGETLRTGTALSLNASTGNVKSAGDLLAGSGYLASANGTRSMYMYDTSGDVSFQGKVISDNYRSQSNASNTLTFTDLDATFARNLYVTGIATVNSNLVVGGDVRINGNDIQSSTGQTVITLSNDDATFASDLTVSGNLYVNGSTTQVNTSTLTVEDRTIQLGVVDGAAPSSATTWDLGVLFNYYTDSAKQSAVVWEHGDARFKFGSVISDGGGTDSNSPQITVSTFAPIEVSALWVTDCAGTSQVISCTGSTRYLENITIDAGQF